MYIYDLTARILDTLIFQHPPLKFVHSLAEHLTIIK